MPYKVTAGDGGFYVVNAKTGKRMSNKPLSKKRANAQMRALYANEPAARKEAISQKEIPSYISYKEDYSDGIMVALMLPANIAEQIAIPGGQPADSLHCTLAYLGKVAEWGSADHHRAAQVVRQVADYFPPLVGKLNGGGIFQENERQPVYANLDAPGLPELRQYLVTELQKQALLPANTHGYTPHITLEYTEKPKVPEIPNLEIVFPTLTLMWGGDRQDFTFKAPIPQPANKKEVAAMADMAPGHGPGGVFSAPGMGMAMAGEKKKKKRRRMTRATVKEFALATLKHLVGKHNQLAHGRRGGGDLHAPGQPIGEAAGRKVETADDWLTWKIGQYTKKMDVLREAYKREHEGAGNWKKMAQIAAELEKLSEERAPFITELESRRQMGFSFLGEQKPAPFELEMQTTPAAAKKKPEPTQTGFAMEKEVRLYKGYFRDNLVTTFKHLAGKHEQKRHGWRFSGDTASMRRSMAGQSKAETEEYKRRARLGSSGRQPMKLPGEIHEAGMAMAKRLREIERISDPRERLRAVNRIQKLWTDAGHGNSPADVRMAQLRLDAKAQMEGRPMKYTAPRELKGTTTKAMGVDPSKSYDFEFKVVDLKDLIPSNLQTGEINPKYDPELQPRMRSRSASQQQIDGIARDLNPEALLTDFHTLDKGPMIVGSDNMVESGNGRVLALERAANVYPEKFAEYKAALKGRLDEYGIKGDIDTMERPILVRMRTTPVNRADFAKEGNAPSVMQMSPLEVAKNDARLLTDRMLSGLKVGDEMGIDQALRHRDNSDFVQKFLGYLPANERASLIRADGSLNRFGLWRIKAAVFSKVFPGEAGIRLADTFLESLDSSIKNFETAISGALPRMAQAEALIASGKRNKSLSLAEHFTKAVDMLARLREVGTSVTDYIGQSGLFGDELTGLQKRLLVTFDNMGRRPTNIRQFFNKYADLVINATPTGQTTLFGSAGELSFDKLVDELLGETEPLTTQGSMF